jgi:hypothetical protein
MSNVRPIRMRSPVGQFLSLLLIVSSTTCFAAPVFRCITERGKVIEVTRVGTGLTYAFGRAGTPEITLNAPINDEVVNKWNGIGRYQNYFLNFSSGKLTYQVYYSWDSLSASQQPDAGVEVSDSRRTIAKVRCSNREQVIQDIEALDVPAK